jgi:hypothetical protein
MLASLTPSVELTGGPWYSDQDLDTVFIDMVLKVAKKQAPLLYPTCHSPLLPTAEDVLDLVRESGTFTGVELYVEHMETPLDILVYDGFCEKIDVLRPNVDGFLDDDDDTDSATAPSRGRAKGKSTQSAAKRSRLDSDAENSGGEGGEEDFELPPPLDDKRKPSVSGAITSKRDRPRKRPPTYVVYRCIPDYTGSLGRCALRSLPRGPPVREPGQTKSQWTRLPRSLWSQASGSKRGSATGSESGRQVGVTWATLATADGGAAVQKKTIQRFLARSIVRLSMPVLAYGLLMSAQGRYYDDSYIEPYNGRRSHLRTRYCTRMSTGYRKALACCNPSSNV